MSAGQHQTVGGGGGGGASYVFKVRDNGRVLERERSAIRQSDVSDLFRTLFARSSAFVAVNTTWIVSP